MSLPLSLKGIQPFIKVANEMRKSNAVVAYLCDLHAMQTGMKIDMRSSPDAKKYLINLMTSLEKQKAILVQDPEKKEALTVDLVGQNIVEEQARKLFVWSDGKDRNSEFGKNVVRAFYTSAILYDVAEAIGGELDDESVNQRKYARWKATYIHNCLKNNETPMPGPIGGLEDELENELNAITVGGNGGDQSSSSNYNAEQQDPPSLPQVQPTPRQQPIPVNRVKVLPAPTNQEPEESTEGATKNEWPSEVFKKAEKYCKYAISSITYQDVPTALDYLSKSMHLLRTGKEP